MLRTVAHGWSHETLAGVLLGFPVNVLYRAVFLAGFVQRVVQQPAIRHGRAVVAGPGAEYRVIELVVRQEIEVAQICGGDFRARGDRR